MSITWPGVTIPVHHSTPPHLSSHMAEWEVGDPLLLVPVPVVGLLGRPHRPRQVILRGSWSFCQNFVKELKVDWVKRE